MCDLCDTRKLVGRADRVIRALLDGSPINAPALAGLVKDLRNDLARYHNQEAIRAEAVGHLANIVAKAEAAATGNAASAPSADCTPETIH